MNTTAISKNLINTSVFLRPLRLVMAIGLFAIYGSSAEATPVNQTWSGGSSGTWDTTSSNWSGTWTNGNDALFQNGGTTTVTIQPGGISADALEIYNNGTNLTLNGGTLTLTSTATGNGAPGTAGTNAAISNNNSATLVANSNIVLGAASGSTQTIVLTGGAVAIDGGLSDGGTGVNLSVTTNNTGRFFQMNGSTTLAGTTGITISGGGGNGAAYLLGGNISLTGTGAQLILTDSAGGSLASLYILGGTNTLASGVNLQFGVLSVSNAASLGGAITFNGGSQGNAAGALLVTGSGLTSFTGTTVNFANNVDTQIGVAAGSSFNVNVTLTGGSGHNGDFNKFDAGNLTISGNNNSYNRFTELNGGTTTLDYSTNNNNKISSGNNFYLGGDNLVLNAGSFAQTVGNTTLGVTAQNGSVQTMGGASSITQTGGTSTIALGALTQKVGNTLDVISTGVASTTTSNTNNILGPWATYGSGTSMQYATGGGTIAGYSGATALLATGGSATSNYSLTSTGQTLTASESAYTLQYSGSGAGVLALGGNTFTLNGLLNDGTGGLTISGSGGVAIGAAAGVANNELIFTGPGNTTISSVISGSGALTDSSTGTLSLTGANTYTGNNYFNAGTVAINTNSSLGAVGTGASVYLDGGTLQEISGTGALTLDSGGSNKRNIVLGPNGGTINVQSTDALTVDGNITSYLANLSGGLTKTGAGTLVLSSGSNNFNGGVYINGGVLQLGNGSALGTGNAFLNAVSFGASSSGTLALNGNSPTILGLTGDSTATVEDGASGGSTLDVILSSGTNTFSGAIINGSTGALGLTKDGAGTLILAGSNTYTGGTIIVAGSLQFGNGTTDGTLSSSSNVADSGLGGIIFNNINTESYGGVISGIGNLTKSAGGIETLNGVNTYTGTTTITAGTLAIGSAGQLGSGSYAGNISNAGAFSYGSTAAQTLSGVISGAGTLTEAGSGTLTLTGVNTYTGATSITGGTLAIGGAGQLNSGSYAGNIADAGTLSYGSSVAQTLSGVISGTGTVTEAGAGTLTLTGSNNYSGGTTISGGTLKIGNVAAAGTGAIGGVGTSAATLDLNGFSISNQITNADSNNFVITNSSATAVTESGQLGLNSSSPLSNFTITGTGNILFTGNIVDNNSNGNTITINGSNTVEFSSSTTASLNAFTVTSGTLVLGYTGSAIAADHVNVNGGTLKFDPLNTTSPGGDWQGQVNGGVTITSGTFDLNGTSGNNDRMQYIAGTGGNLINSSATAATLTIRARANGTSGVSYTLGSTVGSVGGGVLNISFQQSNGPAETFIFTGSNVNWIGTATVNSEVFQLGNQNAAKQVTISLATGNALAFSSSIGSFNVGGLSGAGNELLSDTGSIAIALTTGYDNASDVYSGALSGTGSSLTKTGTGTQALSGANTYSGGTTLSTGTLVLNNGASGTSTSSAIGTGNLTISGGTLDSTVSGITLGTNNTQNWNGSFTFLGSQNLNLGTGAVTLGATPVVTVAANTLTEGGAISGTGLGLTKAGTGTLALTGSSTYTGVTTINSGTVTVSTLATEGSAGGVASSLGASGNAAANLVFNGGALTYTGGTVTTDRNFTIDSGGATINGSGSGAVTFSGTASYDVVNQARSLTLGGTNQTNVFSGLLANNGTGPLSLTMNGSNTWDLTNANTFTGAITLNSGTLAAGNGNGTGYSTGATPFGNAAPITLNGGTLAFSSSTGGTPIYQTTFNNSITVASSATIGQYEGNNIITGALNVNAPLTIYSNYNNKELNFDGALTGSGAINLSAGSFAATQLSTTFSGTSTTYNGTITATASGGSGNQIILASNTALQNATLALTGNGSLASQLGATYTNSELIFAGAGTSNPNTGNFFGTATTSITAPVIGGLSGSSNILLQTTDATPAAVNLTVGGNGSSTTYSGVASGPGGLIKAGSGTLTLSGTNTYVGTTQVNAGTLALSSSGVVASSSLVVNSGGTFDVSQVSGGQTYGDLSGSGGTVALGNNVLTLGDANSTTFSGSINDGGIMGGSGASLIYSGTGTFTLAGVNGYTGPTTINNGTLALGINNAINSASTITLDSAMTGQSGVLAMNGFNDSVAAVSLQDGYSITGPGTLTSASAFDLENGFVSAVLAGSSGANVDEGGDTVVLSGANTFTGITQVSSSATVNYQNGTAFGTYSPIQVAKLGTVQVQGGIAGGNQSLTFQGVSGTLENVSGINSFGGAITLQGTTTFISDADSLSLTGGITNGGNTLTVKGPGSTVIGTGAITGTGGLTTSSSANLDLIAANSYTGATSIGSGTTLQIGNGGTTGKISTSSTITDNGSFVIDRSNAVAEGTDFKSGISGSGSLQQIGTGVTTLGVANTYTGGTTVSAGKIFINGGVSGMTPTSGTGTGAVTVNGGTLAGSGNITTSSGVTVSSGGTLASGDAQSVSSGLVDGTHLTMTNTSVTLASANLTFDLGSGNPTSSGFQTFSNPNTSTTYMNLVGTSKITFTTGTTDSVTLVDLTNTTGNNGSLALRQSTPYLLVAAGSDADYLNLVINSGTIANPVYSLSQNDTTTDGYVLGVWTGTGFGYNAITFNQLASDGLTALTPASTTGIYPDPVLYLEGGDLEVVPEPGTWALMLGGLALLVVIQRRKNKIG